MAMRKSIYKVVKEDQGVKHLEILGSEYEAYGYDWYIFSALEIVERWAWVSETKLHERATFDFIRKFRDYIRENYNHGHDFEISQLETFEDCRDFINLIIQNEAMHIEDRRVREDFLSSMIK